MLEQFFPGDIEKFQMLNAIPRVRYNTIFLVPWHINRFKKNFPEARVLAAGATKARKMKEDSSVQYEPGWISAKRGVVILSETELRCCDWIIPLETVREATLFNVSGGSVLKIATNSGDYYQFGLQRDPAWTRQTALALTVQRGEIGFSAASVIMRLFILIFLILSLVRGITLQYPFFYLVILILVLARITWSLAIWLKQRLR